MSTQTTTLAYAGQPPQRVDRLDISFPLPPRAIVSADLTLEIHKPRQPSEWQTAVDMFRQRTQLRFFPISESPGSNDKLRGPWYDQDEDTLFLGGWDRPQPYDGHTTFLQYILMFRYTPVFRLEDATYLGFFDQSFQMMEALFLSPALPKLRAETIMLGMSASWHPHLSF